VSAPERASTTGYSLETLRVSEKKCPVF